MDDALWTNIEPILPDFLPRRRTPECWRAGLSGINDPMRMSSQWNYARWFRKCSDILVRCEKTLPLPRLGATHLGVGKTVGLSPTLVRNRKKAA
jgi:hypothetical protein